MVQHWSGATGGAEIQVRYLIEHILRSTQHDVYYVCRKANLTEDNTLNVTQIGYNRFLGRYLKAIDYKNLMAALKEIRPDVIYTRVSSAYVGIAADYCARHGAKLVYHIAHQNDLEPLRVTRVRDLPQTIDRHFFVRGLRRADLVIGQAHYQNELLQKRFQRSCSAVIANFHPVPEPSAKDDGKINVLWVANIKNKKRPEIFVRLARALAHVPNAQFGMIGACRPGTPSWKRLTAASEELPNFLYCGGKPLEFVNEQLAKSHIFVNTSVAEGFPNTFIQSWLREVPVVTLSVDPDDLIKQHRLGMHSGTFEQLVLDTQQLIRDPHLRGEMGRRARVFATENNGMDNAQQIVELLEAQC